MKKQLFEEDEDDYRLNSDERLVITANRILLIIWIIFFMPLIVAIVLLKSYHRWGLPLVGISMYSHMYYTMWSRYDVLCS